MGEEEKGRTGSRELFIGGRKRVRGENFSRGN